MTTSSMSTSSRIKTSLIAITFFSGAVFGQPPVSQHECQTENIPPSAPLSRFIPIGEGNIVDSQTGLMWRICLEGSTGDLCDGGEPVAAHWADALLHPANVNTGEGIGGYNDWRLPNIRELSTLVEQQCVNPAINMAIFSNTPPSHVWTSSPYNFYTHYSWYVDFANGAPTYDLRTATKNIRLVRDMKNE